MLQSIGISKRQMWVMSFIEFTPPPATFITAGLLLIQRSCAIWSYVRCMNVLYTVHTGRSPPLAIPEIIATACSSAIPMSRCCEPAFLRLSAVKPAAVGVPAVTAISVLSCFISLSIQSEKSSGYVSHGFTSGIVPSALRTGRLPSSRLNGIPQCQASLSFTAGA